MEGGEEEGNFCTVLFFFIAKGTKMSLKFLTGIFPPPDTFISLFTSRMDDESILCLTLTLFLFFFSQECLYFVILGGTRDAAGGRGLDGGIAAH